jgi:hypothetical protein
MAGNPEPQATPANAAAAGGARAASQGAMRRVELLLFLLLWSTYAYFYQSGQHNEAARLDLARTMIEERVLWVDRFAWNSADVIAYERDGERHIFSNKAPGATLVIALPLAFASALLRPLGLPEWIHWHAAIYATAVLTVSLLSAAAGVALFRVGRRVAGSAGVALLGVVAVWLGSIAFPFSTLLFGHQLAAAFLAFSFAILFALRSRGERAFRRPALALGGAGFLAGLAVVTEYPTVLLAALLSGYLCIALGYARAPARRRLALAGAFAAGAGAAGAILVLYNWAAFGKLFYIPYQAYTETAEKFPGHAAGFLGMHWPGAVAFARVLAELTVRPQRGLVYLGFGEGRVYALGPVLWLALPGLVWLRRAARPEALLVLSALAVFLIFNACYGDSIVYWGGAVSVGPRHVVPMLPFLALPIALAARRLPWAFVPLLAISVFYALLATAIEPRVGYEYAHPSRDLFLANYLEGRFALGLGGIFDPEARLLTADSVAFNLGKLAGLRGTWQLAPLLAVWVRGGGLLARAAATADGAAPGAARGAARLRARLGSPALVTAALAAFAAFVVAWPLAP